MEQAVELGIAPVVFLLKAYRFVQSTYLASYQEPGYEAMYISCPIINFLLSSEHR